MEGSSPPNQRKVSKHWNILLWIVQVLIAASFGISGFMKLTAPMARLAAQMVWPGDLPEALVRFIGASELLAAIGLILPSLTRIRPSLTVLAAWGLITIMIMAIVFHLVRSEFTAILVNVVLAALAFFVAWGRSRKAPIADRDS